MSINLENTVAAIGQNIKSLHNSTNKSILDFSSNIKINDGTLHKLGEYFNTVEEAQLAFPGVPIVEAGVKLGVWSDVSVAWAAAWLASISDSLSIYVPNGRYIFNVPLILRQEGQKWYSDGEARQVFKLHHLNTAFEFVGDASAFRTVITRRKYREFITDAEDDPLVACVQIENIGIKFNVPVVIEHNEAFALANPDNMVDGDPDWDIGIFVGCRVEVDLSHVIVLGHHKVANVYIDVTRGGALSELFGFDGVQNPKNDRNGVDGLCMDYSTLSGGRWRYVILGALFKTGYSSYGGDYTKYLNITFNSNPEVGETLTLGEQVFIFGDTYTFGQYNITVGEDKYETISNLIEVLEGVKEVQDSSRKLFNSASFVNDGDIVSAITSVGASTLFNSFTASTTSSAITLSGTSVSTRVNPAPYYDNINGPVLDSRGAFGASDVTGYRMCTLQSAYLDGRRVWEDIRGDLNHIAEGLSAGAMYIDVASANSSRKGWGQRYIGCRFSSYDPFIVRLDKCARITFLDCHTEPGARTIKSKATGEAIIARYGSYANTKNTWALNIEGANAAPSSLYFKLQTKNSNLLRSYSGFNSFGGRLIIESGDITIGKGSIYQDPATLKLYGGSSQDVFFGNVNNGFRAGRINYATSSGIMTIRTGGTDSVSAYQVARFRYDPTFNTARWDTSLPLDIRSNSNNVNITSAGTTNIAGDTSVTIKKSAATLMTLDDVSIRHSYPLRPTNIGSTTQTIGTSVARYELGYIKDVRMTPPTNAVLTASGELAFEYVSDTQVRLKLRGTDGVSRSVVLTLS